MSMYPTDISGSQGARRSNRLGLPTQTIGIEQQLGVNPMTPAVPNDSGVRAAQDMARAFGIAAETISGVAAIDAREQERLRIAQEAEDREAEMFDRGEAVKAAASTFAELQPQISERKLIAGVDDSELGNYVGDLIESRSIGQSSAWKNEYDRQLRSRLLSEFGKQRAAIREDAINNNLDSLKNAAIGARTSDEIVRSIESAKALGVDERKAYGSIAIPALRLAAAQGDREKFDAIATTIPSSMYQDEVQVGRINLEISRARNRVEAQRRAEKEYSTWYSSDPLNPPPFDDAIERLNAANLTEDDRRQWSSIIRQDRDRAFNATRQSAEDNIASLVLNNQIDEAQTRIAEYATTFGGEWELAQASRIAQIQQAQAKANIDAERDSFNQTVIDNALRASESAIQGSGAALSQLPKEFTVQLSNGTSHTIKRDEIIESVVPLAMTKIAEQNKDNPAAAFSTQVAWLASNGVSNPTWAAAMNAGSALNIDALKDENRRKAAVNGFNLYRSLSAENSVLALRMTDSETRKLYDMAESELKFNGGDAAAALLNARAKLDDPNYPAIVARATDKITAQVMPGVTRSEQIVANAFKEGIRNKDEIRIAVEQLAKPKIMAGDDADGVLTSVANKVKSASVIVGGANNRRAIYTGYDGFTPAFRATLPTYADAILDEYANGQGSNYKKENLSLAFDSRSNTFAIVDETNRWTGHKDAIIPMSDFVKRGTNAIINKTNRNIDSRRNTRLVRDEHTYWGNME